MAARTCMLCGKALSRIWAGNGEDFCSREHRNQYRLRRGMDRLLEANKVANVMRRRENPRQIPTASLHSRGPASQRGFFDPQLRRDVQPDGSARRKIGPALQNRLEPFSNFREPRGNRGREQSARTIDSNPLRCAGERALPPPVTFTMAARIVQARPSQVAHAISETAPISVVVSLGWRRNARPGASEIPRRVTPSTVAALESAPPAQSVAAPCQGRALRVSLAAGFRVPDWTLESGLCGPDIPGMVWPDIRSVTPRAPAGNSSPTVFAVPVAAPPLCVPQPPPADFERRFEWPGTIRVSVRFVDCANARWTASAPFGCPDDFSLRKEDEH